MRADLIEMVKATVRIVSILVGIVVYILAWCSIVKKWDKIWDCDMYTIWQQLTFYWLTINCVGAASLIIWAWS